MTVAEMPTITTVFLGEDGLHHARCGHASEKPAG